MSSIELQGLVDEYLLTLNDDDEAREELFRTPREYARAELDGFVEWLRKSEAQVTN